VIYYYFVNTGLRIPGELVAKPNNLLVLFSCQRSLPGPPERLMAQIAGANCECYLLALANLPSLAHFFCVVTREKVHRPARVSSVPMTSRGCVPATVSRRETVHRPQLWSTLRVVASHRLFTGRFRTITPLPRPFLRSAGPNAECRLPICPALR
jgi:hypothetical protein